MNKRLLLLLVVLLVTGCSFINKENHSKTKKIQEKPVPDYVDPYIDENPIKIGLYWSQSGTRTLMTSYDSPCTQYQDIISFEVYYTNEPTLIGKQPDLFNQYYQTYQGIESYKIGYHILFDIGDEKINKTILKPSDVNSFFDYIQIYLYDDIHQDGGWYDHISEEEMTDQTLFTSIKLTASTKIDEITSPITLVAFTYDNDDFDEDGNYRGKSSYQVIINKK